MKKQAMDVFDRAFPLLFIVLVSMPLSALGSVCEPLPPPAVDVISVATVSELESAINSATPRSTILLADGIYALNGVFMDRYS